MADPIRSYLIIASQRSGTTPCCAAPLEVAYEDLVAPTTYEQTMLAVVEHLGVPTHDVEIPPPPTRRQADATSDAWIERFRRETGSA